ncbi:hypothetical protein M9H77_23692 [Catharanthus roseus]|uniref:Uncharacterized protein n=1 Tax=Catharanthus roseus TaxID=4058 RepID=A0ACC0AV01_CATRO|nr:hypothetical protein M9H77_00005 [Catharanthus roseus]KAI5664369.1 hypothetical protein M9H77_23692 [Catharanthus roseus]
MEGTLVNQPKARLSTNVVHHLLQKAPFPSSEMIEMARIQAEDLFEVKVEIIKLMEGLEPMEDWMGRGTRALENSRTSTGEYSLEKLYDPRPFGNSKKGRCSYELIWMRTPLYSLYNNLNRTSLGWAYLHP